MTVLDSKPMPIPDGLEKWLRALANGNGQAVLTKDDAAICLWCQSFGIVDVEYADNEFGDSVTFVYLVGSPAHRIVCEDRSKGRADLLKDFVTRDEMVKVLRLLYERSGDNILGEAFDSLATRLEKRTLP